MKLDLPPAGDIAVNDPPAHHAPDGRYRNPWPMKDRAEEGGADVLKWGWQRLWSKLPPDPAPGRIPRAVPEVARPALAPDSDELRVTWLGQSSFLIQAPGLNLLTDPVLGGRASPVSWAGPRRFSPPGLSVGELPPVDAVVLSHDHYDHLDARTVAALRRRAGGYDTAWITPLGYAPWFRKHRVRRLVELDWWGEKALNTASGAVAGFRALPARHWSRRHFWDTRTRLWCSWALSVGGRRLYFGGDSGYCPAFAEIGDREPPFDAALLPIGAYEPRWFMRTSHMNPEEAVQASLDVRASRMVAMHWGTFRLTDEDPLEPPARARAAWDALGLPPDRLHIPAMGETLRL